MQRIRHNKSKTNKNIYLKQHVLIWNESEKERDVEGER